MSTRKAARLLPKPENADRFRPDMNLVEEAAVERLLTWLAPADPLAGHFDCVIGFGHFDLRIAERCAEIFRRGDVGAIIFTGGIGAGTADLGQPEADAFRSHLAEMHPDIPPETIVTENASTNTGDNIRFTLALLRREHPALKLDRVALVANPSRQRRVRQTWRQLVPGSVPCSAPPTTTVDEERRLFAAHGQNLIEQLIGEVDRLAAYPARGWIAPDVLPDEIVAAAQVLRQNGKTK